MCVLSNDLLASSYPPRHLKRLRKLCDNCFKLNLCTQGRGHGQTGHAGSMHSLACRWNFIRRQLSWCITFECYKLYSMCCGCSDFVWSFRFGVNYVDFMYGIKFHRHLRLKRCWAAIGAAVTSFKYRFIYTVSDAYYVWSCVKYCMVSLYVWRILWKKVNLK